MFCQKCGKEIDDEAVVCINCGCAVSKRDKEYNESKSGMGVLLALLLGVIGLVIGVCIYPEGTIARKTFIKSWCITYGVYLGFLLITAFAFAA